MAQAREEVAAIDRKARQYGQEWQRQVTALQAERDALKARVAELEALKAAPHPACLHPGCGLTLPHLHKTDSGQINPAEAAQHRAHDPEVRCAYCLFDLPALAAVPPGDLARSHGV